MPAPSPSQTSVFAYLKRAFLLPWNLMIFGGAAAAAAMSPDPHAFLALVGAGEILFLGGLISIPKFRDAVDAERYGNPATAGSPAASLQSALDSLPYLERQRFERLLTRCRQMRTLAAEVAGERAPAVSAVAGEMRTSGLDSLLWGFLRLLRHHSALERLLATMNEREIQGRLDEIQLGLKAATAANDERLVNSYKERLATTQARLDYYHRTLRDAQFVAAELDRVEDKIQALSEMAVNQSDPDALSAEIDAAAASMQQAEVTMSQLRDVTGVAEDAASAPAIMDAPIRTAKTR